MKLNITMKNYLVDSKIEELNFDSAITELVKFFVESSANSELEAFSKEVKSNVEQYEKTAIKNYLCTEDLRDFMEAIKMMADELVKGSSIAKSFFTLLTADYENYEDLNRRIDRLMLMYRNRNFWAKKYEVRVENNTYHLIGKNEEA